MDDSMQRVTYGELKQKIIDVGRHLSVKQLVVIEMGNNMDSVIFLSWMFVSRNCSYSCT